MTLDLTPYPLARIAESDFDEMRTIMAGEDDFPPHHFQWEKLAEDRKNELEGDGDYRVIFIDVKPANFRRYLERNGGTPNWQGLADYVGALAMRQG